MIQTLGISSNTATFFREDLSTGICYEMPLHEVVTLVQRNYARLRAWDIERLLMQGCSFSTDFSIYRRGDA